MQQLMRLLILGSLLLGLAIPTLGQQEKSTKASKAGQKLDSIPGYKKFNIEGFTLLVHQDVLNPANSSDFERKPMEVLELELKMISSFFANKPLNELRKIPIWVEWDDREAMGNGRSGTALAVYYGGHQSSMLRSGLNPLKANSVVILRMVSLTKEHQPKTDSRRCVLLHEMAHAVHHQLFTYDNPSIKQAFKQAMERKLYDRSSYAATNDAEYFAELTCAYFNRIDYFPHDREDLKKHDKLGYTLMENIWGKASKQVANKKSTKTSPIPYSSEFNLDMSVQEIDLGNQIAGKKLQKANLQGKVVIAILHRPGRDEYLGALSRVEIWWKELEDFGLVALVNGLPGSEEAALAKDWQKRFLSLPLFNNSEFNFKMTEKFFLPHALVYDTTGKCVFRGEATGTEKIVRWLLGNHLAGRWEEPDTSSNIQSLLDLLEQGTPPIQVINKAIPYTSNPSKQVSEQAKKLITMLTEKAQLRLDDAIGRMNSEPVVAFIELEKLSTIYKGTSIATKASTQVGKLAQNKDVAREKSARTRLEIVRKIDSSLNGKEDAFDPFQPSFQQANRMLLSQLQDAVRQMEKQFSGTIATQEAAAILRRWIPNN